MKFRNPKKKNESIWVELSKIADELNVDYISGMYSYNKQIGVDEIIASESRSKMFNYEQIIILSSDSDFLPGLLKINSLRNNIALKQVVFEESKGTRVG